MRLLAGLTIVMLALSGCYEATIHLKPEGPTTASAEVENEMHFSLLGIFELGAPVNLDTACPGGTAAIREQVGILGGAINLLLGRFLPIFHVMNPTALCSTIIATEEEGAPRAEKTALVSPED